MKDEIKTVDSIPVGKKFRVMGDSSLLQKDKHNQLLVFLRAEGFWVAYPQKYKWRLLKAINEKGVEFLERQPKYRTKFSKKVLARLTPPLYSKDI